MNRFIKQLDLISSHRKCLPRTSNYRYRILKVMSQGHKSRIHIESGMILLSSNYPTVILSSSIILSKER